MPRTYGGNVCKRGASFAPKTLPQVQASHHAEMAAVDEYQEKLVTRLKHERNNNQRNSQGREKCVHLEDDAAYLRRP